MTGRPVTGPEDLVAIALRPVDDDERAAILREIEKARRVETPLLEPERRTSGFEEIDRGSTTNRPGARRCAV